MITTITTHRTASMGAALAVAFKIMHDRSPLLRLYVRRIRLALQCLGVVVWRRYWRGPIQPGWTFLFEVLLEIIRKGPPPSSVQALRKNIGKPVAKLPLGTVTEKVDVDGVPSQWVVCCGKDSPNVILYLHGGGYALMSVDTHKALIARISRACNVRLDYLCMLASLVL
eukprot:TRINITY_DN2286_c0_g1_i1.p1 TRINITY_DN2286_c0_g1~~TRINITY_DN2286_c0_g1_i1.p1  ORF type:complete len:169 (-),score=8.32 TRINITY_DN2286_c0_g1_i1:500-1006(-)